MHPRPRHPSADPRTRIGAPLGTKRYRPPIILIHNVCVPSSAPKMRPKTVHVRVKPLDPGVRVWTSVAVGLEWFERRHGKFAKIPTIAFLPGSAGGPSAKHVSPKYRGILASTGTSLGTGQVQRDIIFFEKTLRLPYHEFYTTLFHELHEYRRLESLGWNHVDPVKSRGPFDPQELRTENLARTDWELFCGCYRLHPEGQATADKIHWRLGDDDSDRTVTQ